MLQFVYLIVAGAIRLIIMAVVMFLVTRGDLDMSKVSPYINDVVNTLAVGSTGLFLVGWLAAEKWYHGLVPNSPFKPMNLPQVSTSTQQVNSAIALAPASPVTGDNSISVPITTKE